VRRLDYALSICTKDRFNKPEIVVGACATKPDETTGQLKDAATRNLSSCSLRLSKIHRAPRRRDLIRIIDRKNRVPTPRQLGEEKPHGIGGEMAMHGGRRNS
jgi:hypothetical protein